MNLPFVEHANHDASGGINQRLNGRVIADREFTDLVNVDISVPGVRVKRLEPVLLDDLLQPTVPPTPTDMDDTTGISGQGVCQVTVSWGAVIGAISYELKLYLGADCVGELMRTDSVSASYTSFTYTGLTPGLTYSWTVQAIGDGLEYANSNVSPCDSFTTNQILLDDALPDGVVDTAYSGTIGVDGGATPYTFAVTSGSLPDGLTLDPDAGTITGTLTVAGIFSFTVTVTDDNGCEGSRAYGVEIISETAGLEVRGPSYPGGGTGVVLVPASPAFALSSWTIEFWYREQAGGLHGALMGNGGNSGPGGADIFVVGGNLIDVNGWLNYRHNLSVGLSVDSGVWHHFAVSADGTSLLAYFDGVLDASCPAAGVSILSSIKEFILGNNPTQYYDNSPNTNHSTYTCRFRFVRISSNKRYTTGFTPSPILTADANTVALWTCLDGSGVALVDSSGNGHDGTLTLGGAPQLPLWIP